MSDVVQVDLFGNNLSIFDKGAFEGLESLRHLHLAKNKIELTNEELLEPLHSLQVLDLSHNSIIKLPKGLLKRSSAISELKLENNPLILEEHGPILESATLTLLSMKSCSLEKFSSDAFGMLPRLEKLYLSRNHVKVLPVGLLTQQAHLKYLDISFNLISTLTVNTFRIPTNLRALHCYQNPLEDGLNCTHFLDVMRREDLLKISHQQHEHHSNGSDRKLTKEQIDSQASAAVPNQDANTPEEKNTGGNMGLKIPTRHDEEQLSKRHEENDYGVGVTERIRIKRTDTDPYLKTVSTDSTSIASQKNYSQNDTTVQSTENTDITNILIYAIIGAGIICLILVIILLWEVLYIVKQ